MAMNFLVYRREKSLVHKLPALLKIALLFFISIRVFSSSEFFLFKSFDKDFLFINTAIFFRTLFYFILTVFFTCFKNESVEYLDLLHPVNYFAIQFIQIILHFFIPLYFSRLLAVHSEDALKKSMAKKL